MQPLRNELYVKPFPATEQMGLLAVPDSAKKRPSKALVLKTGKGTQLHPMTLQEGDIVFHIQGAGYSYPNEQGEDIWLIKSTDCLAYIPKQD